jgi:hypothetical protein
MKRIFYALTGMLGFLMLSSLRLSAQELSTAKALLRKEYNLIPNHSRDTQYYKMESRLQKQALDGTIKGVDVYRLYLRCVPSGDPSKGDEYTCIRFSFQANNTSEVTIPSLAGWKYYFSSTPNARDTNGQVFGIDHDKFEKLKDEKGNMLPIENNYHVYNAFIDFHSMSVFAERTAKDSGVQNLKYIGDKIVHSASYSQPPVNLGSTVAEGSYFRNGEVTLAFKGLGLVNDRACAILEYDSGKSSFYMLIKPFGNMEIPTKGSSHYWGDIFKDLHSGWIQLATLHEVVVSETTVSKPNNIVNAVIERSIRIENVKP